MVNGEACANHFGRRLENCLARVYNCERSARFKKAVKRLEGRMNRFAWPRFAGVAAAFLVASTPLALAQDVRQASLPSPLTTTQIRSLENTISRLPAEKVVDADGAVRARTDISRSQYRVPARTVQRDPQIVASGIDVRPAQPTLVRPGYTEIVELSPALEQQTEAAVTSNTAIRNLLTNDSAQIRVFPGLLRQTGTDGETLNLKAFAFARRNLRYDPDEGDYVGTIAVGLANIDPRSRVRSLSAPEVIEVSSAGTATPSPVTVTNTSPPLTEITIRVPTAADGARVRVVTRFDSEGIELTVPIQPQISVALGAGAIEGWGIGTSTVTVTTAGLRNPEGRPVSLTVDPHGYIEHASVRLDANGHAETELRSESTGKATVTAQLIGLPEARDSMHFDFPFRTLVASLLGSLVGALIRLKRQPPAQRKGLGTFLISALVGVVVWAAHGIGISLLPYTPGVTVGSLAVFALSALGAFGGARLLDGSGAGGPPPEA